MNHRDDKEIFLKKCVDAAIVVLAIVILYVFFHIAGIGCLIKFLTGISCPGCGMTRAWISMLRFHFKKAFFYHPLVLLPIPGALIFLLKYRLNTKVYKTLVYLMIVIFLTAYFIRMAQDGNGIVVFEPENGLVYRILHHIFN